MITLKEIKSRLEKADNPLFFFDDDPDGLSSYLLLKKYFDKGKGVAIKNAPDCHEPFLRKVDEHSPDLILVLDQHDISHHFVENVNVPIIWIDHHPPINKQGVHYFNPRLLNSKDDRPVSYWCYQITKQDLWLAMIGVIGDWHLDMLNKFKKQYPDLVKIKVKEPGDIIFNTEYGYLIKMFSFLLKGKTSDVRENVSILTKIRGPYELINKETSRARFLYRRIEKYDKEYQNLLDKALQLKSDKVLAFTYPSSKNSFTSELSNELIYKNRDKIVVVARDKDDTYKISLRTNNKKGINLIKNSSKIMKDVQGNIGGHEHAMGGNIKKEDFNRFISNLRSI